MSIRSIFRRRGDLENWQAGDLAECVNDRGWFKARTGEPATHEGPRLGGRYVVQAVCESRSGTMLTFARFGDRRYIARAFRKVRPQADAPIAADAEFAVTLQWILGPVS